MAQFKKGYYQADCQNGVTYVGKILEEDAFVSDPDMFLQMVPTMDHGDIITTFLDESTKDIFDTINEKYGVK